MTEEKKELSLGREIAKEVAGDVCGIGAGALVGGLLSAAVDAIPGIGKGLKLLLKFGVWGIEVTTLFGVKDQVEQYTETVFDAIDSVKALFDGTKKAEETKVQVEGAVE